MQSIKHHELKAEWVEDDEGPAVMLTQAEEFDEPAVIIIHPHQLRQVCENFGIVAADEQAEKTIATLKRRMLALSERIDHLQNYIENHSDHKHADLTYELVCINALADLAEEWCADFQDSEPAASDSAPAVSRIEQPGEQASLI